MSQQKFQLNLPGLLKVLAEHLYSTRKVAIRELIQNAHDSTVRRNVEDKSLHDYHPHVSIIAYPEDNKLIIQDNGAGLTESEIIDYLTTIGNSYTRELGQNLEFFSPDKAGQLIGQFGLGFLSAFLIASEITLTTRSFKESQGYRWYSDGSESFVIEPQDNLTIGTRVEITLKPEAQFLLSEPVLIDTVRQYADFVPVPIYVNDKPDPVNIMRPPWQAENSDDAILEYIYRLYRLENPIAIIPLHDHEIDLGHDTITIPLSGFLFIPPKSVVSVQEYGDARIFIRRMFITDRDYDLLPNWAKFVRGVIDCPVLQPTASREDIHQEDNYFAVQDAIGAQLLSALHQIASDVPDVWRRILLGHTDLVLGWITEDDTFFKHVADDVILSTSRGSMTVSEYLKESGNTFYYVTRQMGSLQEQLIGEGYEVPVIEGNWYGVQSFISRYADERGNIRMVQMDGDSRELVQPVAPDRYAALLKFYKTQNIRAMVADYKPAEVPALMMYPRNAEAISGARRALDSGDIDLPIAGMIEEFLNRQGQEAQDEARGTLYLNASSPLIQQLVNNPPGSLEAVLLLLYQVARLFAARNLTPAEAKDAFDQTTSAIQRLI